ncbi:ATP-dependent RNA helicase HrpA [Glaciecola sp. 2405UD65-10]|uniref:ATP-dependent RNA helicase HrpA n=1 Tax=Glaciecola sp. 2405UD65-10 TaxID=3397244 RepID=UPI003B5AB217
MIHENKIDVSTCLLKDRFKFTKRFHQNRKISDVDKQEQQRQILDQDMAKSSEILKQRLSIKPYINYPDLPVSDKKDDIKSLIEKHQVVIIAGETGSGKTTQIPKMCLELGRGREGMIAHTQPRRLAARSVANRIADELQTEIGSTVGFKVRFTDQVSDTSLVKLLTDGMLLAEMQQDRFLNQYDTIIIDEAHERSLNIDFLLGYLKRILPKRPDLKVIITSATIDPQRFSKHFNDAPVVEVSGRSFPVEIRYRDYLDEENAPDQIEAIALAVDELFANGKGDILVFLSSEREIRETQQALQKKQYRHTEVIPLYARLSASDQQKIFHPKGQRRIVLSTNVAETSLTVPGIKYVIDTGFVRMSRYSHRLKVQRLPIEPISQASAKQRAGRCGRTSSGICIRLYSEQDFLSRDEFTDPEITRTHLSSVILQMLSLGLGEIEQFEFIQAPEEKFIKDGVRLLQELEAVEPVRGQLKLTPYGRNMAKLPLDPKYARMLLAAKEYDCVYEVMIITAGLSVQDPRERPHEQKQKADLAHGEFADKNSDLLSLFNVFQTFKQQQQLLTQNQLRKWCNQHFIHYQRMREWQDIVHQVKNMLVSAGLRLNKEEAEYQHIHMAIATGLLSQIGMKDNNRQYLGARNSQFKIFPGSSVFSANPKWIMAAELVETSQLYARQVAKIEVEWIEGISEHLTKKNFAEPHWSKKRGAVMAYMNVLLFGLPIVNRRLINYSKVNEAESQNLFIRHALVENDTKIDYAFLRQNQSLVEDVELLEKKTRRRDILVDEEDLIDFYHQRIPSHVCSEASFKKWWQKTVQQTPDLLNFEKHQLLKRDTKEVTEQDYPDVWQQNHLILPLEYQFEPNQAYDGVCLQIPLEQLNQLQNTGFDWLVPGMRHELVVALIKSLPKKLRRNFVPAPDYAQACLQELSMLDKKGQTQSIVQALSTKLFRMSGVKVEEEDFDTSSLDSHLQFNFAVVNESGKQLGIGKSLIELKQRLKGQLEDTIEKVVSNEIEQQDISSFDIETLPEVYTKKQNGFELKAYPAFTVNGHKIDVSLFTSKEEADRKHKLAIIKLIKNNVPSPVKYLQSKLPNKAKLSLYFNPFGEIKLLIDDIIDTAILSILENKIGQYNIREQAQYKKALDIVRMDINDEALKIAQQVESGLSIANSVQKYCKGSIPINIISNISNVKQHLNQLVFKGFVFATGEKELINWNRYLKGLLQRCEKLKVDPNRDRLNQIEIDKALNAIDDKRQKYEKELRNLDEFTELYKMVEELRISLFAQQLGTQYPISLKRIMNKMNDF